MSVAFVPERLRGKVEVNQETLQRVSETGPGRGRDGAETGPGLSRTVTRALPAPLGQSRPCRPGGAEAGAGGDGALCRSCWRRTTS